MSLTNPLVASEKRDKTMSDLGKYSKGKYSPPGSSGATTGDKILGPFGPWLVVGDR